MVEIELLEFALQCGGGGCLLGCAESFAGLEIGECYFVVLAKKFSREGQLLTCGGSAISTSDFMDDSDCFLVQPFPHQVLWRLIDGEKHKSNDEFNHRYSAHGDDEIPPSHVLGSGASGVLLAREITQERPCNKSSDYLSESPID